ncbi:MAG: fused MFS/spermidine synthase, partial [Phycisphaeraceae bacterium]|nr:fused MFS/spermidine synthase [Phycisphaeraceae bacterium]
AETEPDPAPAPAPTDDPPGADRRRVVLTLICFLSGFGFLALEVLWTRMFMQVLENSVYTFAAILVLVLLALAAGAFVSSVLARVSREPLHVLSQLLLIGGLAVAVTPFVFIEVTDGGQIIASRGSWSSYVSLIFGRASLVIGPPALLLGAVFPFLMKTEEQYVRTAGWSLGRLGAINTAGAILGSLLCGFVFLGTLGMWTTMQLLAATYLLAGLVLPLGRGKTAIGLRVIGAVMLVLLFTLLQPSRLPVTTTDPGRSYQETVLATWEASDATVSITEGPYGRMIRLNSHYGLGSTGGRPGEVFQNDLPLMVHPDPDRIFFLGMGTGITAGAALDPQFDVERVVACELSPQVIDAARQYFTDIDGVDYTNGLFDDPRASVLAEDGRHYLMATEQRFDVINGDLFVPFRSGIGSLYTREHFQTIRDRLEPDGVFFQWLPLYQLTEYEFSVIARTMNEVFDQVTLWRGRFHNDRIVALAGHRDGKPLTAPDVDRRDELIAAVAGKTVYNLPNLQVPLNRQTSLLYYAGNLTKAADLFGDYPVNTDDRPVIEYMAPRSYRQDQYGASPWLQDSRLIELFEKLQQISPPDQDPMLANLSETDRRLPEAGLHLYRAQFNLLTGNVPQSRRAWAVFQRELAGQ